MSNPQFVTAEFGEKPVAPTRRCSFEWSWATWCCLFFVAVVLTSLVVGSVALGKIDTMVTQMSQQLVQKHYQTLLRDGIQVSETGSLFSLASIFRQQRPSVLMLCSMSQFYTLGNTADEPLFSTSRKSIAELSGPELKDAYYSAIASRLRIVYNVDPQDYPQWRLDARRKFMSVSYNITSRLTHFSTIKLVELEFDTPDQSIRTPRSLILCTNNPAEPEIQRCDQVITKQGIMLVHGERVTPLFNTMSSERDDPQPTRQPPLPPGSPPVKATQGKSHQPDPNDKNNNVAYVTSDDERTWNEKQSEEIMGERVYNIIFYRMERSASGSPTTTTVTEQPVASIIVNGTLAPTRTGRPPRPVYEEREILMIEPALCKVIT